MKRALLSAAIAVAAIGASATPAHATLTVSGVCQLPGYTEYDRPLTPLPQEVKWVFRTYPGAECTGPWEGEIITTPVEAVARGKGPLSCGLVTYTLNGRGKLTFPELPVEDQELRVKFDLVALSAQNVVYLRGVEGGQAFGRASFFGQNDPFATTEGCLSGNGPQRLNFTLQVATAPSMSG